MAEAGARPSLGPGDASPAEGAGRERVSARSEVFPGAERADEKEHMATQSRDSRQQTGMPQDIREEADAALAPASAVTSESVKIRQPRPEIEAADAWTQHLLVSPVSSAAHAASRSPANQPPSTPGTGRTGHLAVSGAQPQHPGFMPVASPGGAQKVPPSLAASAKSSPQVTGRKRKNPGPRPRPRQAPQLREGAPFSGPAALSGSSGGGAASGASAAGGSRSGARLNPLAGEYNGPARLTALPVDICLDILRFLSPEDLASCSRTCSFLRSISGDDRFWRRAYCLRWGQRPDDVEAGQQRQPRKQDTWKQAYMQRDSTDMASFLEGVPQDMRRFYVHMQASKRSTAPTAQQAHAISIRGEATLSEQISAWRRSRNLPAAAGAASAESGGPHGREDTSTEAQRPNASDAAPAAHSTGAGPGNSGALSGASREAAAGPRPGTCAEDLASHVCSGQHCTYHRIGNVFLCERTGKAHMCGDSCGATVVDPLTELLVCAVSGRCFDRIIDEREGEDKGDEGAGLNPNNEDDGEVMLGAGRLGAAFALGYDCENEEALRQVQRLFGGA